MKRSGTLFEISAYIIIAFKERSYLSIPQYVSDLRLITYW